MLNNLFAEPPKWAPPKAFPVLNGVVGCDLETCDPLLKTHGPGWAFYNRGYVVGVSLAWVDENGQMQAGYWPLRHEGGGNVGEYDFAGWLRSQLAREDLTWVFHHALYDMGWLRRGLGSNHVLPLAGKFEDTVLIGPLLDDSGGYGLDKMLKTYLGQSKDERALKQAAIDFGIKDIKANLWKLPAAYVGGYAEQDAKGALGLYFHTKKIIEERELDRVYNLEKDVAEVVLEMRWRGVRTNQSRAEQLRDRLRREQNEAVAEIKRISGVGVDIWAAESIAKAFGSDYYPKTAHGAPSFTADFLESCKNPIGKLIVKARQLDKTRGTFVEGYILGKSIDGRIHAEFNQLLVDDDDGSNLKGTVSGRFSSSNPNLQNLPTYPEVRGLLEPEEGHTWACFDFSSQEPRWLVHETARRGFMGAQEFCDEYNRNPRFDFYAKSAERQSIVRKKAKVLVLSRIYGAGKANVAHQLGCSVEEAQELIATMSREMPFVTKFANAATEAAKRQGFVRTVMGRRAYFNMWEPENNFGEGRKMPLSYEEALAKYGRDIVRAWCYKAANRIIQGNAAEQNKSAMVKVYKTTGRVPLLTMHDENDYSLESTAAIPEIRDAMQSAIPCLVPTVCDIEIGPDWGHITAWVDPATGEKAA